MGGVEKDEGALLRGPLLIEAQKWFDKRSQDLSEEERSFINASRSFRERLDGQEKKRQEKGKRSTKPIWRRAPVFGQVGSCNKKFGPVVIGDGAAGKKSSA